MSHRTLPACLVATLFSVCGPLAESQQPECLDYEKDTRLEPREVIDDPPSALAQAEALLVASATMVHYPLERVWRMEVWPWTYFWFGQNEDTRDACSDRDYHGQPRPAANSGVLVGANLVLTAKHVVVSEAGCIADAKIVFGYGNYYPNQWEMPVICDPSCYVAIPDDDVYSCEGATLGPNNPNNEDWAVIELDRDVTGRSPLPIRRTVLPLPNETPAWLVGHPNAVPTKLEVGEISATTTTYINISNIHALVNSSGSMGASRTGPSGSWEVLGVAVGATGGSITSVKPDCENPDCYREWFSNTGATATLTPAHLASAAIPELPVVRPQRPPCRRYGGLCQTGESFTARTAPCGTQSEIAGQLDAVPLLFRTSVRNHAGERPFRPQNAAVCGPIRPRNMSAARSARRP